MGRKNSQSAKTYRTPDPRINSPTVCFILLQQLRDYRLISKHYGGRRERERGEGEGSGDEQDLRTWDFLLLGTSYGKRYGIRVSSENI